MRMNGILNCLTASYLDLSNLYHEEKLILAMVIEYESLK